MGSTPWSEFRLHLMTNFPYNHKIWAKCKSSVRFLAISSLTSIGLLNNTNSPLTPQTVFSKSDFEILKFTHLERDWMDSISNFLARFTQSTSNILDTPV